MTLLRRVWAWLCVPLRGAPRWRWMLIAVLAGGSVLLLERLGGLGAALAALAIAVVTLGRWLVSLFRRPVSLDVDVTEHDEEARDAQVSHAAVVDADEHLALEQEAARRREAEAATAAATDPIDEVAARVAAAGRPRSVKRSSIAPLPPPLFERGKK